MEWRWSGGGVEMELGVELELGNFWVHVILLKASVSQSLEFGLRLVNIYLFHPKIKHFLALPVSVSR